MSIEKAPRVERAYQSIALNFRPSYQDDKHLLGMIGVKWIMDGYPPHGGRQLLGLIGTEAAGHKLQFVA